MNSRSAPALNYIDSTPICEYSDTEPNTKYDTERSKLFCEFRGKGEALESGCDFRYKQSKRIIEIIKLPWDSWKPSKTNYFSCLPIEVMSHIGNYISPGEEVLLYKLFAIPWFSSSDELSIKILKECMKSLEFASHPILMFPTNTFDPQPQIPPISFYENLGTLIDKKIEMLDANVKLFQHFRTLLRKEDKYKYETFAINEHSLRLCLHCVVPAIMIDDMLQNTNFRRRQSILSLSNVEFNSGPVLIEFDCENCCESFGLNVMQKSQFNLLLQLVVTGEWEPRLVLFSNFISSENISWVSKKHYIQINGTGRLMFDFMPYDDTLTIVGPRLAHEYVSSNSELEDETTDQQKFDENRAVNNPVVDK